MSITLHYSQIIFKQKVNRRIPLSELIDNNGDEIDSLLTLEMNAFRRAITTVDFTAKARFRRAVLFMSRT